MTKHAGLYFLRIRYGKSTVRREQLAAVTDLSTGFGIKRGFIQNNNRFITGFDKIHRAALLVNRQYLPFMLQGFVAIESGLITRIFNAFLHGEFVGGTRLFALTCHGLLKTGMVDGNAAFSGDIGSQVNRETECVIEPECGFTIQYLYFLTECSFQNLHAILQRLGKALFFLL